MQSGTAGIRKWLATPGANGEVDTNLRVYFLGPKHCGKSSLARALAHMSALPNGIPSSFSKLTPNLVGADATKQTIEKRPQLTWVDFPGRADDTRIYVPFLSRRNAVYLVIAPIVAGVAPLETVKTIFGYWLSALTYYIGNAPRSHSWRIQLVLSKSDLAEDQSSLQKLQEELHSWVATIFSSLPIAEKICIVAVRDVSGLYKSIVSLRQELIQDEARTPLSVSM